MNRRKGIDTRWDSMKGLELEEGSSVESREDQLAKINEGLIEVLDCLTRDLTTKRILRAPARR